MTNPKHPATPPAEVLFELAGRPVHRGDMLHVSASLFRNGRASPMVKAEFPAYSDSVTVRCDNGAVPTVKISQLSWSKHPEMQTLEDLAAAGIKEPTWRDIEIWTMARATPPAVPQTVPHPDDLAVERFALAMKAKMAKSRAKGRGGWDDPASCEVADLARMLVEHVPKGDPVDVANFCMMLHQRGDDGSALRKVAPPAASAPEPLVMPDAVEYYGGVIDERVGASPAPSEAVAPSPDLAALRAKMLADLVSVDLVHVDDRTPATEAHTTVQMEFNRAIRACIAALDSMVATAQQQEPAPDAINGAPVGELGKFEMFDYPDGCSRPRWIPHVPGGQRTPDNDCVICPNCTHQFPAIPVNLQQRLREPAPDAAAKCDPLPDPGCWNPHSPEYCCGACTRPLLCSLPNSRAILLAQQAEAAKVDAPMPSPLDLSALRLAMLARKVYGRVSDTLHNQRCDDWNAAIDACIVAVDAAFAAQERS